MPMLGNETSHILHINTVRDAKNKLGRHNFFFQVKQQDALLKKESAKLSARTDSVASSVGADDSILEERIKVSSTKL